MSNKRISQLTGVTASGLTGSGIFPISIGSETFGVRLEDLEEYIGTGSSGSNGTSGTSGLDGTSGSSGSSGVNGLDGTSGTSGSSGSSGVNGLDGTSGTSGSSGVNGLDGTSGSSGTSGQDGSSGSSGESGSSGSSGVSGSSGESGSSGTSGTSPIISGATNSIARFITDTSIGTSSITEDNTNLSLTKGNPNFDPSVIFTSAELEISAGNATKPIRFSKGNIKLNSYGSSTHLELSGLNNSFLATDSTGRIIATSSIAGSSGTSGESGSSGSSGTSGANGSSGTSGESGSNTDLNYTGPGGTLGTQFIVHNPYANMTTTNFTLNTTTAPRLDGFYMTGFVVDKTTTIDGLGFFGGGGNNFTFSVAVGIYDAKTASVSFGNLQPYGNLNNLVYYPKDLLSSATFSADPPTNTQWQGSGLIFKTIPDLTLQPNTPYFIGSYGTASNYGALTVIASGTLVPRPNLGFAAITLTNAVPLHINNAMSGVWNLGTFSVQYPFTLATMSLPSTMPDGLLSHINASTAGVRFLPMRIKSIP